MPIRTLILLTVVLLALAGIIYAQIKLSKSSNKWLGLIIPLVCFSLSLIIVFALVMNTATSVTRVESISEGGVVSEVKENLHSAPAGAIVAPALITLFLANIPTLAFLLIYYYCRSKIEEGNELKKMSIQDLE